MSPSTISPRGGMADEPSPPIDPIDPDAESAAFRIGDPGRIAAALQSLAAHADLVTVYPADGGGFLSCRVVEAHAATRRLVFEVAGAPQAEPGEMLFVAMPQGIKLQFRALGRWQERADGGSLQLATAMPSEIVHAQRRRFPRLQAPLGPAFRAEFVLRGQPGTLSVDDLSIGGVGLRTSASEGRGLMQGQLLRQVRLQLGEGEAITVNLEICSRRSFRSFLAGEQVHFGCRFVDLTPEAGTALQLVVERFGDATEAQALAAAAR